MTDDLLLHPQTRAELTALQRDAPQAMALVAPDGTGKRYVAYTWATALTKAENILVVEPDEKGTISIDTTRSLYQRTRAKQTDRQVVIIDHAEAMSQEAQNSFLKLLEEPRAGLTFILTAPHAGSLLPTIVSRVHVVHVQPLTAADLTARAKQLRPPIDQQTLQQLLFVASGRPATLVQLVTDADNFDQYKTIMLHAKQLLGATPYERLCMAQELGKDRQQTVDTLEAMAHMLMLQIRRDPSPKWLQLADTLQTTLLRLRQNGNTRAQLTHLFLSY